MNEDPFESKGDLEACLRRMEWGRNFANSLMGKDATNHIPYREPLLDAVHLFEKLGIRYALIGGVATMFYGRPRATEDVDFIASSGHMKVLEKNPDVMRSLNFDPSCVWKLYHAGGIEVDIWKDEFVDDVIERSRVVELIGQPVAIAEANDLVAMKLRAARRRDDADISDMIQSGTVNAEKVRSLVTPEQFAHFLEIVAKP